MSNKKDLTRIEDLSEYLHDLEDSTKSFEPESDIPLSDAAVPDLPELENTFAAEESSSEEEEAFSSFDENPFDSDDLAPGTFAEGAEFKDETSDFSSDDAENHFDSEPSLDVTEENDDKKLETIETFEIEDNSAERFSPAPTATSDYKSPENFQDLRTFGENTSFTGASVEGNPSFSVLIKGVRFVEDATDILTLIKDLKLLSDEESQIKARLQRGQLLIPRISEFAAIMLAHKLRRFDIDIQVGLSDEIHTSKNKEVPEVGLVSKVNLYQNQTHHFEFDHAKIELSQVIVATTASLENFQIMRYLGVATEHMILEGHQIEDEYNEEIPRHYQELAQKLKAHAIKAHGNAVVGLNYQLTPLPVEFGNSGTKYRLTCSGNLVWVIKI